MIQQTLDSQELLLILFLDRSDILTELDEVAIKLLLGLFSLLLTQDQVNLVRHTHPLVLLLVVDTVGNWVRGLSLDESCHFISLLIHSLLSSNQLFELVDQV